MQTYYFNTFNDPNRRRNFMILDIEYLICLFPTSIIPEEKTMTTTDHQVQSGTKSRYDTSNEIKIRTYVSNVYQYKHNGVGNGNT